MNRKYEIRWSDKAIFPYANSKVHSFKVEAPNLNKAWIKFLMHNQLDENVHEVNIWVEPMSSYKIRKEKKNAA
tara:strand:+ start:298 stop:516 length:219 start_codon:yes stop_codon:yes gene_type:complete